MERDNAKDPQDPNSKFHMMKTRGWESVSLHIQFNASTGEWKNQGRVGESPETATKNRTLQQKYLEFFENHRGQGFEVEEIKNLVGGGESAGVILCRMTNRGLISSCRSKISKKRMIYGLDIDHPSPSTVCITPVNSNLQIQCG